MRPRLQDRGDLKVGVIPPIESKLQCGHGSKTVEICPECETGVKRTALQCGHGSKTVEIGPMRCPLVGRCRRFNAATAPRPWR